VCYTNLIHTRGESTIGTRDESATASNTAILSGWRRRRRQVGEQCPQRPEQHRLLSLALLGHGISHCRLGYLSACDEHELIAIVTKTSLQAGVVTWLEFPRNSVGSWNEAIATKVVARRHLCESHFPDGRGIVFQKTKDGRGIVQSWQRIARGFSSSGGLSVDYCCGHLLCHEF